MSALNRFIAQNCANRFEFDAYYHAKILISSPFTLVLKDRSHSDYSPEINCIDLNKGLSFGCDYSKKFGEWISWKDLKIKTHHDDEILLNDYFTNMGEINHDAMVEHLKSIEAVLICEFRIDSVNSGELDVCLSFLDSTLYPVLKSISSSFKIVEKDQLNYEQYGRCGLTFELLDEYFIDVLVSIDGYKWNIMNEGSDWKLIQKEAQHIFVTPKLQGDREYFFKLVVISKTNTWVYYDLGQLYPESVLSTGLLPLFNNENVKLTIDGCVLSTVHPNMFHLKMGNYPLFHLGCSIVKSPSFHNELNPILQVIVEASAIKKYEESLWREITLIGHELNSEQLKSSSIDTRTSYKVRSYIACKFDRFRHGNITPKSNPLTAPSSLMMWNEIPHVGEVSKAHDTFLRVTSKSPILFVFLPQDAYSKLYEFTVQARLKTSNSEADWVDLETEPAVSGFHLQKMQADIVKCSSKAHQLLQYGKNYSIRIMAKYNNCKPVIVKEFTKKIPIFNYIPNLTTDILERNGGLLIFNSENYYIYLLLDGSIIMVDPNIKYQWNETKIFIGKYNFTDLISEKEMRLFFLHSYSNQIEMRDESAGLDTSNWRFITRVEAVIDHHPPHNLRLPKETFNYSFDIVFNEELKKYQLIDNSCLFDEEQPVVSIKWRNEELSNIVLMDYYSHSSKSDEKRACGTSMPSEYPQRVIHWYSNFYLQNGTQFSDLSFDFTS